MTITQRLFEDVEVGEQLPELRKGPMTNGHLMRWSAAIENWHRIHYDQQFSLEHDKNPGLLINGSWKQHVLVQLVKDWAGPTGWVLQLGFQYRGMDVAGKELVAAGTVDRLRVVESFGVVDCSIRMGSVSEEPTTVGTATVLLKRRGSRESPGWSPDLLKTVEQALHSS